jgi:protein SCO1/2
MRGTAFFTSLLLVTMQQVWAARAPDARGESAPDPKIMQIDEVRHLGNALPKGLPLIDAEGREATLGELLGKPAILLLSYYSCDGTCPVMNRLLYTELPKVERFRIGQDYRVLTVSFDKADTQETAAEFVRKVGIPAELRTGWHHAVVKNRQTDVAALAGNIGFRFFWSNADKTFLHPNVLVFLTPEGRIARYLYGTKLDARAIQLALIDADWGRIAESASVIDMLTGVCFSYNYAEGRYQPNYPLLIGFGSLLFGLSLMAFGAFVFRRKWGGSPHAQ